MVRLLGVALGAVAALAVARAEAVNATAGDNFVFLQRFPLTEVPLSSIMTLYHTEIVICPRNAFSIADQSTLDGQIRDMRSFAKVEESWWKSRNAWCVSLGFGSRNCEHRGCGIDKTDSTLNNPYPMISNVDEHKRSLYLYGTGALDGWTLHSRLRATKCWSNWAGSDYDLLRNNCNTFTSTVLHSVYGLSQSKPGLGVSDMTTVKGRCFAEGSLLERLREEEESTPRGAAQRQSLAGWRASRSTFLGAASAK